jgi:hypothetical protein
MMANATCPGCGAEVQHVEVDGERIPLERFTEPSGDRRYRIIDFGPPMVAQKVSPYSAIDAYPDHRKDCPHFDNGLRN